MLNYHNSKWRIMVKNDHWNSCFLSKIVCSCFKIYLLVDYFSNMVSYSVYDMSLLVKYEHCSCRTLVNDQKHLTCFQRKSIGMNTPEFSIIYSFNLFFMLLDNQEDNVRAVCCLSYCFLCKCMLIFFITMLTPVFMHFDDILLDVSILTWYISVQWSPCGFVPWTMLYWTV